MENIGKNQKMHEDARLKVAEVEEKAIYSTISGNCSGLGVSLVGELAEIRLNLDGKDFVLHICGNQYSLTIEGQE